MAEEVKPIGVDTGGFDSLRRAALALLSAYPGLEGQDVVFENLDAGVSGLGIGADSGALIMTQKENIMGRIKQTCQFPFFVIYRTPPDRDKLPVADFLATFGQWISRQTVTLGEETYQLTGYPTLTGNRKITNAVVYNTYGAEPEADGYQDWMLPVIFNYTNEYNPW